MSIFARKVVGLHYILNYFKQLNHNIFIKANNSNTKTSYYVLPFKDFKYIRDVTIQFTPRNKFDFGPTVYLSSCVPVLTPSVPTY